MWAAATRRYRAWVSMTYHRLAIIPGGVIMPAAEKNLDTLDDLFWHEIGDLYSAEDAADRSAAQDGGEGLGRRCSRRPSSEHLQVTHRQLDRLQQIFDDFDREPDGTKCKAMAGLIEEGEHILKAKGNDDVRDAGIIAAAQRVEHYEIAGYGTARALATRLGHDGSRRPARRDPRRGEGSRRDSSTASPRPR